MICSFTISRIYNNIKRYQRLIEIEIYRVEDISYREFIFLVQVLVEVKAVDIDRDLPRIYIDRILRYQACINGTLGNCLTAERLEE